MGDFVIGLFWQSWDPIRRTVRQKGKQFGFVRLELTDQLRRQRSRSCAIVDLPCIGPQLYTFVAELIEKLRASFVTPSSYGNLCAAAVPARSSICAAKAPIVG